MADKFLPFNPETAKNGDVTYYSGNHDWSCIYIGPCVDKKDAYVSYNPRDESYGFCWNKAMLVKAPKKIVWVNLVKHGLCGIESSVFDCEKIAKGMASKYAGDYLGTFPIEIDDVA